MRIDGKTLNHQLKFVAISDTHCRHRNLKLPKGDVLIHAGDISNQGTRQEIADFLDWFGKLPFAHKIFIAGNHDFFFEREKDTVLRKLIPEGVHYLKDEAVEVGGVKVWGSPYTPWFTGGRSTKGEGESSLRTGKKSRQRLM